jgi:hypothetical protein
MGESLDGLDRVPELLRGPVREYAALVRSLGGDNVVSLTLFGVVMAGSFDPHRHTVRSVLVVERVDLEMLRALAGRGSKLGKDHIAAPLVMTAEYIRNSLDAFPLEFLEIQQQHATLFGPDAFAELTFDERDVRLQCERELKVILIGLRQGLLASMGKERALGELEAGAAAGLLRTLRGMLWLKGQKEAKAAEDVTRAVESLTGRRLEGLRTALDPTAERGWPAFELLYQDVAELGALVDAW